MPGLRLPCDVQADRRLDGPRGSRRGNAALVSFSALLQMNVLNQSRWRTHEELRLAIVTWIEDLPPPATTTSPRQAHADRV